jgi:phosphate:Na+ symporter
MWLMTEGLKVAAGGALRSILETWTSSALRGLAAGVGITAIVQSSSAVVVATVGFVNAGLLTLNQAMWVVFGTNVGTTMTGWLVALIGVRVDVGLLALPMLGSGMLFWLATRESVRLAGAAKAVAGFACFFLGVKTLQGAFLGLAPSVTELDLAKGGLFLLVVFLLIGIALTILTQSSSAALTVILTAGAGAEVPLNLAAAAVVGTNIGTTSTALLASIGATPAARRVAIAHIAFNLAAGTVALALLPLLAGLSSAAVRWGSGATDTAATLAVFHTMLNCLGLALMWPLAPALLRHLSSLYVTDEEVLRKPRHLDPTLAAVPAIALRGLVLEVLRMRDAAFELARRGMVGETAHRLRPTGSFHGILGLGQAVRDFIGRLSRGPLPEDVVAALPDLIRAVQHLEELAAISGELPDAALVARRAASDDRWSRLQEAVLGCLAAAEPNRGAQHPASELMDLAARVETAYQAIKQALLHQAAVGRLAVEEMEVLLQHAQTLRRGAEAARKAQQRLTRWTGGIVADQEQL